MVSLSSSPLWVLESSLDVGDTTVPCAKSGQLCKSYAFHDAEKAIVTPASSQNKITDRSKCLVNGFNKAQLMDFKSQSIHGITALYIQGSAMDESSIGDGGRIICSLVSFGSFEGIKTLCEDGKLHKALQVVDLMSQTGLPVSTDIFICLLQGCIQKADLAAGRRVQGLITRSGFEGDAFLGTHLVRLYALCGRLLEADQAFNQLSEPSAFAWSAIILAHAKLGTYEQAIKLYHQMQESSVKPDGHVFVAVLKACSNIAAVEQGKLIHHHIVLRNLHLDVFVSSTLIDMYVKCGSLEDAFRVFNELPHRDVASWTTMITGYVHHGHYQEALKLFQRMREEGIEPNGFTFVGILKACSSMDKGKLIHDYIIEKGVGDDVYVINTLIDMYTRCGNLEDACRVLVCSPKRNAVTWNTIIAGYAYYGYGQEALWHFNQMQHEGVKPNQATFVNILKACSSLVSLVQGKQVHDQIIQRGLESDAFIVNTLIDMYVKCGSLANARRVFDETSKRDVVAWTAMIAGYVQHEDGQEALQLFHRMKQEGVDPNVVTFASILKACSNVESLDEGKLIHDQIKERGLQDDVFVVSALIDLYAKHKKFENAQKMVDESPHCDVVLWNALIAGYAQHGYCHAALQCLQRMQQKGMRPDQVTFVSILKACSSIASLHDGKQIHGNIIESGLEFDVTVGSSLIDMYVKCGSLEDSTRVFDRLPNHGAGAWSAIIAGYAQNGHEENALQIFQEMHQEVVLIDTITYISILNACARIKALDEGKQVHAQIKERGLVLDAYIRSALIDMYMKCGSLQDACRVFDESLERDVVIWTAIIAGYVQHGDGQKSLQLFQQMKQEGVEPNQFTFACILMACASIGALAQGKKIHKHIKEIGILSDPFIATALIDMYAKCGSLEDACRAFDEAPKHDVVTWNTVISGCARYGKYQLAVQYFNAMQENGLKPAAVTFVSILFACGQMGLVDEGFVYLQLMINGFGIMPTFEHYNCIAELLGSSGHLSEAEDMLETIPFQCCVTGWMSLLNQCRKAGNVELGRRCFDWLVTMDSTNASEYALMSDIYNRAGMGDEAAKIEDRRKCANALKKPGKAFIEVDSMVHGFTVGDQSHPQSGEVHAKLKSLCFRIKQEGYMPAYSVPDGVNEDALWGHCEKQAIAFGLLMTSQGTTIRVSKNLRMCTDCHNTTEIISKIERREIVVIDDHRIHQFIDGTCHCCEYH